MAVGHATVTFSGAGVRLVGDVYGPADRPPVLLLHGGGQTRRSWHRAALWLQDNGLHAVTVDLRGHGESSWARDEDYDIGDFACDVTALCREFDTPPVVVGASLGGLAALVAVGETADPVARALVLVDVTPQIEPTGAQRVLGFMQDGVDGFDSVEQAADAVAGYLEHRERPAATAGLRNNLRRAPDGRWYWHWDPSFVRARLRPDGSYHPWDDGRLDAAAARIGVPTLLVRGARSDVVSEENVRHMRELIPHAEVVDVADAGHMVAGDRNDRFNHAMLPFIERVGG